METSTIVAVPEELTLTLGKEHLDALGLGVPAAGTELHISAVATVTSSSTHDPDADGDVDYCCVVMKLKELTVEQPEVRETRSPFERRDQSAARLYSMPHAPSNIVNEEYGVLQSRYGK